MRTWGCRWARRGDGWGAGFPPPSPPAARRGRTRLAPPLRAHRPAPERPDNLAEGESSMRTAQRPSRRVRARGRAAFTLVEMLIVIAIMVVLTGLVLTGIVSARETA